MSATRAVLVIYSNNRLLPANIEADRGLREVLTDTPDRDVELFSEFLDLPAFSGPTYHRTVVSYLADKYAVRRPEVIVAGGGAAFEFLLLHRDELFPGVPVVHVGVDGRQVDGASPLPPDVVGVAAGYDFAGSIRLALRWHPDTRRLTIVTGASALDRQVAGEVTEALDRSGPLPPLQQLEGLSTEVLLDRLSQLGEGDLVFTPGFFRDGVGRAFSSREAAALIASASKAPVYGPYSTFIGTGVVGGRMPVFMEMGREAGRAVRRLLDGTRPEALALPASSPAPVQVDWRQAQRWRIAPELIPPEAVVHFREPGFWDIYRERVIALVAALLIQAAMIVALLLERRARRRTAGQLASSEARMSLASRAAGLSMWMWDVTSDRLWSTADLRRHLRLAGEPPVRFEQVLAQVHQADRRRFEEAVREALRDGEELDIEYRMLDGAGDVRWISSRGRGAAASGHLTGVSLDITARKRAEQQADKDRVVLTHMTRVSMLGQLSASIAHQLNQPLTAILGNAEAARKMLDRDPLDRVELKEICDDIIGEDVRAVEVMRRLAELYKRGEMKLTLLNLNDLVVETLELVRTELMTRHVQVALDLAPALAPVEGGRVQLQQVLLNLILNAADSMNETAMADRRLVIHTEAQADAVRLSVADRGTGIAPEDFANVFDAFWSTKASGLGIGLAVCQSIITAHRGTLSVDNNADGGATFTACWPARQTP